MNGIKMDKFYDLISHYHEAEFEIHEKTFIIQPAEDNGNTYLTIWNITTDEAKCILKRQIEAKEEISSESIDAILTEKCFEGRSFLDMEKEITVTVIY